MKNKCTIFKRPGALVIGGDYQGLGIVRSLGRHGVPVCVIDDERSIARYSRYSAISQSVPPLRDDRAFLETLIEMGHSYNLQGWVLYPTRDEHVAAISQHRDELSKIFRVPTPSWDTVRCLWDKRNTYQVAESLGIPTPKTWRPSSLGELESYDGCFPVAVKPAIKEHFIYETKCKAWRADNPAELRHAFKRALQHLPVEEILVQDLIPGDGICQYSYCAFFKNGQSVAHLTACRRRQHPLEFGRSSTFVETVEVPVLQEYAESFLRAVGYYGLVEVEFKRDPRDGQYRLLDVNGRTWGYHTIGCRAGIDFPHLLFADQMGEPVVSRKGIAGVHWVRLLTDVPTGLLSILGGHIEAREYFMSLRHCRHDAVFSMDDPLPGIVELVLLPYMAVKRGF